MRKVKKSRTASSLGRSLVKDKNKRDRGRNKEDGWVNYAILL